MTDRATFEAHFALTLRQQQRHKDDRYTDPITQARWEGWMARGAQLAPLPWTKVLTRGYGCHCDLEPDMEPDGCVIDEGFPDRCVYAKRIEVKEQCEYWQPIVINPAKQMIAAMDSTDD